MPSGPCSPVVRVLLSCWRIRPWRRISPARLCSRRQGWPPIEEIRLGGRPRHLSPAKMATPAASAPGLADCTNCSFASPPRPLTGPAPGRRPSLRGFGRAWGPSRSSAASSAKGDPRSPCPILEAAWAISRIPRAPPRPVGAARYLRGAPPWRRASARNILSRPSPAARRRWGYLWLGGEESHPRRGDRPPRRGGDARRLGRCHPRAGDAARPPRRHGRLGTDLRRERILDRGGLPPALPRLAAPRDPSPGPGGAVRRITFPRRKKRGSSFFSAPGKPARASESSRDRISMMAFQQGFIGASDRRAGVRGDGGNRRALI